ncbi:MAG: heme-binding protein [Pseudomonadota bacterium]
MGMSKWMKAGIGLTAIGTALGGAAYAQYRDSEEPAYQSVMEDKEFELRDYQPMIVAEVTHKGSRRRASGASFRRLAAYIFAQDRPAGGERIAMTSPVVQERVTKVDENERIAMTSPVVQEATGSDQWRMRFVMPARFTMETLPQPPKDITLTEVPARRMATVRFNGNGNDSDLAIMEAMLLEWMREQDLTPIGDPEYAFYDAPMVPSPMRRNEVMIEVAAED